MLTRSSADAVEPIVEQINNTGQKLESAEGSMLEELVHECISAGTMLDIERLCMDESDAISVGSHNLVEDSRKQNAAGYNDHDLILEQSSAQLAESMRAVLHTARNEIIPKAKEVYSDYETQLQRMEQEYESPVVIIKNSYHPIWLSSQLAALIERYENTPLNPYRFETIMPALDGAKIHELLYTGIDSLDEMIEDYVNDLPEQKVVETYRAVFVDQRLAIGKETNARHQLNEWVNGDRNTNLITYLLTQGLERNPPEDLNISLDQLRLYLARMLEQSGRAIAAELRRRERDQRNRVLVFDQSVTLRQDRPQQHYLYVNEHVFHTYLNDGGSEEALKGALLSDSDMGYRHILDNKEQFEKAWYKHLGFHNQKVSAKMYHAKREALRQSMTKAINAIPDEELPCARQTLHNRLLEHLGVYEAKHFADELVLIRNLIARVIYARHPMSLMVLKAMDQAEADNPEFSARECALFAVIDLMARWCARQIEVRYA